MQGRITIVLLATTPALTQTLRMDVEQPDPALLGHPRHEYWLGDALLAAPA